MTILITKFYVLMRDDIFTAGNLIDRLENLNTAVNPVNRTSPLRIAASPR